MQRILVRHEVCNGDPCVAGTEIRVIQVLNLLETGRTARQIQAEYYPEITPADIRACVRFAQRNGEQYRLASVEGNASTGLANPMESWLGFGAPFFLVLACSAILLINISAIRSPAAPFAPVSSDIFAVPAARSMSTPTTLPKPPAVDPTHPSKNAPHPSIPSAPTDRSPGSLSEAYVKQGEELYAKKRFSEAEQAYLHAVAANPTDPIACNNLGLVYWTQRRLAEAETQYRQAILLDFGDATAHFNLGLLLSEEGRFEDAEREYKRALQIRPGDTGIINNLGHVYFKQKRYDDAIRQYEFALQISPTNQMAHDNLLDARRAKNSAQNHLTP